MKKIAFLSLFLSGIFMIPIMNAQVKNTEQSILLAQRKIAKNLDNWHNAAAEANYNDYFGMMANDAIFIGTDATENWKLQEFKKFSKPYFDAGKAWDFKTIERNIYLSEDKSIGWFDELLDTHMGVCRGSGVMIKENGKWKVQHYVLSIAIPNDNVDEITLIKKEFDEDLISRHREN